MAMNTSGAQLLKKVLVQKQERRTHYSLRLFASQLGVSPTTISQITNGKRALSKPLIRKVVSLPGIDLATKIELEKLLQKKISSSKKRSQTLLLSVEDYEKVSDWYHFAILNLIKCKDFQMSGRWIADRLEIEKTTAEQALDDLISLGLIKEIDGSWQRVSMDVRTETNRSSLAARKTTKQLSQKAFESIARDPYDRRIFSGMMIAIDPSSLPIAAEEINKFKKSLAGRIDALENASEVYHLSIQFFPLTKLRSSQ